MAGGGLQPNGGRRARMITEINVTPLVDIMLVLLIIFMVTTTVVVRDAIEVKLPEAATGEPRKVTLIAITVDERGRMAMNGSVVDERAVRRYIRGERRRGAAMEAVIAADKDVAHGRVVRVIDLLRSEGVVKFAINVLRKEA
jgi:biopolymer transport protein ExbD